MRRHGTVVLVALIVSMFVGSTARAQFTISGTVTDQFSQPVANVDITLTDGASGLPIGIPLTITDLVGTYSIAGLPPGDYIVGFEPQTASRLLTAETGVTIVSSNVTADAQLAPGVILSGFVRDTTGVGIFNIDLKVEDKDTGEVINTPGDNTDSTGFYDVVVPASELILNWRAVDPSVPPYIAVEIKNVIVDADTTIDVTMIIGVFFSGAVTDTLGQPVANVNLDFIDLANGTIINPNGDNTDLLGNFTVHVPIATYDIRLKPNPLDKLRGKIIPSVAILADTSGAAYTVSPGVLVSGIVTDPLFVEVAEVDIDVRDATGTKLYTPFANTGLVGNYQFVVPTGILEFVYQPLVATGLAAVELAGVPVLADTIINVGLPAGITVDGLVTDALLVGVAGVDIDLKTVPGAVSVPLVGDRTDVDGTFTTVVLPGDYIIEVEPPLASRLVATRTGTVPLSADTAVSFVLAAGHSVSGIVTDSVGVLIPGVDVDAIDVGTAETVFTPTGKTNGNGFYEIVVPGPRTYDFKFFRLDGGGVATDSTSVAGVVVSKDTSVNVEFAISTATGIARNAPRNGYSLWQNYPNPFNPTTTITYSIGHPSRVRLVIYDARGARVRTLYEGYQRVGVYHAAWDGRNDRGDHVSSGIYFCRLITNAFTETRKMVLLK